MSTNCIMCVVKPRTGNDLLCDECRVRTALKPCPFCGGHAILERTGDHEIIVGCADDFCEIYVVAGPYPTDADAVIAWNRRA